MTSPAPSTSPKRFPFWGRILALLALGVVACAQILGLDEPLPIGGSGGSDAAEASNGSDAGCTPTTLAPNAAGLYVAPAPRGNDSAAGNRDAPLATLAAALKKSDTNVYVCGALTTDTPYRETVDITRAVNIEGGYECATWTRRCPNGTLERTFLRPPAGLTRPTISINAANVSVERFDIEGPPGSAALTTSTSAFANVAVRKSRISGAQKSPNASTRGAIVSGTTRFEDSEIWGGNGQSEGPQDIEVAGSIGLEVVEGATTVTGTDIHSGSGTCLRQSACIAAMGISVLKASATLQWSRAIVDPLVSPAATAVRVYAVRVRPDSTFIATDCSIMGTSAHTAKDLILYAVHLEGRTNATLDRVRVGLGNAAAETGIIFCEGIYAQSGSVLTLRNSALLAGCPAGDLDGGTVGRVGRVLTMETGVKASIFQNTLVGPRPSDLSLWMQLGPDSSVPVQFTGNLVLSQTVGVRLDHCTPQLDGFSTNAIFAPSPLVNNCASDAGVIQGIVDNIVVMGGEESVVGFQLVSAPATLFAPGWIPSSDGSAKPNGCRVARGGRPLGADGGLDRDINGKIRDTTRPSIGAWEVPASECSPK
jgi:hypothetical protein